MRAAVVRQLRLAGYRAGRFRIGLQQCDDSSPGEAGWSSAACQRNATAYADLERVIGVIGPYDSGCAITQIPILGSATDGAIPLLSPVATYPCLTRAGAGCDVSEPAKYYPAGQRNFVRIAADDVVEAAATAQFARSTGHRRVFILHDDEAYGLGLATGFRQAARSLGLPVVGFDVWGSGDHGRLFEAIRRSRADVVYLAGLPERGGLQLLDDKARASGLNDGRVSVIASDAFASVATAGPPTRGLVVAVAGQPLARFDREAQRVARSAARASKSSWPDPLAIHAAAATRILLDAIAGSDGRRASVLQRLLPSRVRGNLLGAFSIFPGGDPGDTRGPVTAVTFWRAAVPVTTIAPMQATIDAAAAAR